MDIRGVNRRKADLSQSVFYHAYAGLPTSRLIVLQIALYVLAALTGVLAGVTSIGATALLNPYNVDKFTSLPGIAMLAFAFIGILIIAKRGFAEFIGLSACMFCGFAIFFLLASESIFWSNLWGNLFIFTAVTAVSELLALRLGGIVSVADRSLSRPGWFVSSAASVVGVIGSTALVKRINPEIEMNWIDGTISISLLLASVAIGRRALMPISSFPGILKWAVIFTSIGGTSFQNANLTEANFSHASLKHTDFRDANLTRAYWHNAKGLEFSRLDNTYLANPKVRQLVITLNGQDQNFDGLNLEGVNLKEANLKDASFVGANLNNASLKDADLSRAMLKQSQLDGANLSGANLRESILLRANLTDANLSRADLTGACIKDWSFNDQTCLTDAVCDYVYREYENNRPCDRYPCDRNFKPGEFESLFQKLTNAVELVFQDQIDWRALSFTFEKFRIEDDGMGLELKGIEQRGDYWIVKVTHGEGVSKQLVEQQVHSTYDDLRALMESKDRQINQLLGIVDHQTKAMHQQAEALTNFSNHPLGNSFFISGSTITNLAGSGQIDYHEAADQVRSLVTNSADPVQVIPILQSLFMQLSEQKVATTTGAQLEFIQQLIFTEAEKSQAFKQFLIQHEGQIISAMPNDAIATAIQSAIHTVNSKLP